MQSPNETASACPRCLSENSDSDKHCGRCGAMLKPFRNVNDIIQERYRIDRVLKSVHGGWSYVGFDPDSSKKVRINEFPHCSPIFKNLVKTYPLREMRLKSAGILNIFTHQGYFYMVLEFCDFTSLRDIIRERKGKAFLFNEVSEWLVEILTIIQHYHGMHPPIIFSDLSLESFGINREKSLELVDPGINILFEREHVCGVFPCTVFTAPEVVKNHEISIKSDIYSAGMIFSYLLKDHEPEKEYDQDKKDESCIVFASEVPVEFENFLKSMLADKPENRPATINKAYRTLDQIINREKPAYKHLDRGIALFNQGNFEKALAEFKNASMLELEWATAFFWQGMIYQEKENHARAEKLFNRVLSLDGEYESAHYHRGVSRLKLGKFNEAEEDFNESIRRNPQNFNAYLGRGLTFKNTGKPEKAETDFTKTLEMDPENSEAFLWRGLTRYEKGQVDESIEDYNNAILHAPGNAFAYLGRGLAFNSLNDLDSALGDIDRAVQLNPHYAAAYLERGIILSEIKMWETAFLDLNKSIQLDPGNIEAYFYRGQANFKIKRYEDSIKDLDRFISEFPDVPEAYKIRSDAKLRSLDPTGADRDEKKYEELMRMNE
jgi:tetratricopeptide (TPR) repeat protein